jgi:uncharacterized tellurite resistance protein B-like protein
MLDALLRLFGGFDQAHAIDERHDPLFALAALLIETARSDDHAERRKRRIIERVLARRFGLTPDEIDRLVPAAERGVMAAADLFHFTRVVVEQFDEAQRAEVIEMMWEVAYSDGELSADEDALIRRVAGLIYVSDRERGEARRRARERLAGK